LDVVSPGPVVGGNILEIIDVDSGAATVVSNAASGNLTGTADGRLFVSSTFTLLELDPTTGASLREFE
jgi:hypothetical protein